MFENILIKGIVFDLDGTLVRFEIDFKKLRHHIIEYLHNAYQFPFNLFSLTDRVMETIEKAKHFFLCKHTTQEWEVIGEKLDSIIRKYEWEGARKTKLLPTTRKTLQVLKNNKLKLGLFTLEPSDITSYILEKFSIDGYFDAISSRSDVENLKPHPDHLHSVFKHLNISPNFMIVCGDHPMDMKCALDAGAIPVGIRNTHSPSDLINYGARTCISTLNDLLNLLNLK